MVRSAPENRTPTTPSDGVVGDRFRLGIVEFAVRTKAQGPLAPALNRTM